MKKILSLLALMMLCVTGAKAEKVIYYYADGITDANSVTLAEGVTLAITGNTSKSVSSGNSIKVDGTNYKSIKLSNGAQNTLTLPKVATGITFYSYVNKDAATDRSCFWKEVNGVTYATADASGGELTCFKDGANPDVRTYTFDAPTKSITFTNTGEQLCYVMEVEYYEEVVVTNKSIILDATNWGASDARYAVYAFNSDEDYTWIDFLPTSTENNFAAQVPDNYAKIILVRMNGTTTENIWDNKWNQTSDIDFIAITDGTIFTVSFDGDNSIYTTSNPLQEAKDKLAKAIAMAEMLQSADLADAIAAAKEAQNSTDVTVIAASMQTLYAAAKPVATDMLTELVTMANTYGYTQLTSQVIALAQTLREENPDMDAVATQLAALIAQGRTAALEILGKVAEYTETMGNEQLNAAIAAATATAASQTSSISEVMAAVNNGVAAFKTAAEAFVQQVAAENNPDENVQAKLAAFAALGEDATLAEQGEAIRQLIEAYKAYQLELNPVYTVAGTIDLTGYEWVVTENEMTKNEETGIYEWTAKFITVTNSQQPEFKIVRNANWETSWPENNWVIKPENLDGEGVYTITITFDPNAEDKITVTGVKRAAPEFAENNIYFWESPDGYQDQNGGVAVHNNGGRVNYPNDGYYTICLNGKSDFSSDIVTITLDEGNTLEAGDQIAITAYRNKDATGKKSGALLKFDSGKTITTGDGTEFVNINAAVAGSDEYGTEPNTVTITAPETAEGSKTITMTRSQTGTNLFITKIDVTRPAPTRVIADGDYYLKDAATGQLVAGNALNKEGAPLTFTFDEAAGTYTIVGADIFNDVNWSVRSTGDGLTCFISAVINGVKKYVAAGDNNEVVLSAEPATWQPIPAESWEEVLSYNVAGTADLCGAEWDTSANKMTKNEETGLYEWKAENITVSNDVKPEFKIAVNNTVDEETVAWYPKENWVITPDYLGGEGTYNITITFNPTTKAIGVTGEKQVVLAEGKYYLYNVAADGYVVGANNWGTRASISKLGGIEMEAKLADGKYELSTAPTYPGKHLGFNGYVDNGDANQYWTVTEVEGQEGVFTLTDNQNNVLFWDGGEATTTTVGAMPATAANAYWKFVTREDREALFADATAENPVDATFYILNPNFGRESTNSMWNNSPTMAGDNENYNAQKYDTNFDVYQTLTGLKEGVYQLRLQGFYRQGGDGPSVAAAARSAGEERLLATYYAGEKENQLMSIFEEAGKFDAGSATDFGKVPNSQSDATKFLSAGYYENEPIEVSVVGGTLKIGVKKSEAISKDWTVFDNFRLFYTGPVPADELKGDWEAALAAAQAALDDVANAAVTGEERTALSQAIADNTTVEDTADAYRAAIKALEDAMNAFKDAKSAYEGLAAAKTALATLSYKYASDEKKAAAEAALAAEPTSAEDAAVKTDALYVAFRQYAESSALLEGVETAVNFTDVIVNPKAENGTNSWTLKGSLRVLDGEPWTDGEGNAAHKYFDSNQWGDSSWDISLKQDIKLPKGKYQLTVNARANADMKSFVVLAGDDETEMKHIGNVGGLFNNGWNDASVEFEMTEAGAITIGVKGVTETVHSWMSFSDFRLMKFEAYEPVYTVAGAVKANADAEEEASFFTTAWSPDVNTVNEAEETIYLNDMDDEDGDGIYTISYEDVELVPGSTIYYKVAAEHTWNYLNWGFGNDNANYVVNLPEGESLPEGKDKGVFDITFKFNPTTPFDNNYNVDCIVTYDAVATGISSVVAEAAENGLVYNLNGQKVLKPRKGLYIVNGKKVVNK
ncbi:MAG: hypothetical protein J6W19_00205 [Prevotella sp.]|nr:hypothetical protein [Prevotella sp.]